MNNLILKFRKSFENQSGSALLVALLVMGVIVSVSVSLSVLVLKEVYSVGELISYGNSYYATESGTEVALYRLNNELAGWDTDGEYEFGEYGKGIIFEYKVKNKCNSYPCFDEDLYDVDSMPVDKFYNVLNLNESVTIPMFVTENGEIQSVKDFAVEFYVNFDPTTDLRFTNGSQISGWDVLRWRLFGMRHTKDGYVTESINDFTAVSSFQNKRKGESLISNSAKPSWFGTKKCDDSSDRITDSIECTPYQTSLVQGDVGDGSHAACSNKTVRDYYLYNDGMFTQVNACYPISSFMESHSSENSDVTGLNYMTLTNMMNPTMLNDDVYSTEHAREIASRIFYRIETFEDKMASQVARIEASGYYREVKQSLETSIKEGSYMPVFNFSLYSTYKDEGKGHKDKKFYYDDSEPK